MSRSEYRHPAGFRVIHRRHRAAAALRGVRCTECGHDHEAEIERLDRDPALVCPACYRVTRHESLSFAGGCRLKPYITSFDGRDWSGDIRWHPDKTSATYRDSGETVRESDGTVTADLMRTRHPADEREEAADRKRFALRRARGGGKAFG